MTAYIMQKGSSLNFLLRLGFSRKSWQEAGNSSFVEAKLQSLQHRHDVACLSVFYTIYREVCIRIGRLFYVK